MDDKPDDTSLTKAAREVETFSGPLRRRGDRRPALVFLRGELLAVQIPLEREQVTLGRALDADIRINDSRASRLHARISSELDEKSGVTRYRLTDLESTNGTIHNGKRIDSAYLEDGDKFEIGEQLIRFEMLDEIDREFQQQIHRLLVHDELTGLLTSKSFFSELRREAARAEAEDMPFCVLMMDIDHFKQFNDTFGHDAGDAMLREIGQVLLAHVRAEDIASRYGGEELAIVVPDATVEKTRERALTFRELVKHLNFSFRGQAVGTVTLSIGIATYPEHGSDWKTLLHAADVALYRAKKEGRDRVMVADDNNSSSGSSESPSLALPHDRL